MLLKMTNNPEDADDLTIEAFGKAFKNLRQYTAEYAFSTWLFRIAANNCIDFLRKHRRLQFTSGVNADGEESEDHPANLPSPNPGPEEQIIAKQKVKLMRDVVEKLKPHYRMLIEMRYFKELSYEEIAVQLDLPMGTVKAQLFRAREFLYEILKDAEGRI
jgi:RNA polymerase sigma-70 factor (ECF subfamily)